MLLLKPLLERLIRKGTLVLVDGEGREHQFGGGPGPVVRVRLHDRRFERRFVFSPSLAVGEAYVDGTLTVDGGTIYDLLNLGALNLAAGAPPTARLAAWVQRRLRALHQWNVPAAARRNVARHYDLSRALYDLFLDSDKQYSCGYFAHAGDDLETAQYNKKVHIAAKLLLRPGMTVLDIGAGWGGLALFLAGEAEADVTGITLSGEQLRVAAERARKAGLGNRVRFHLRDYRAQTGRFDRIVSVGMFEHVGVRHFRTFFDKVRTLLAEDGVVLLHTIGRADGPDATDPWVRKHIFPGGYIPALSELVAAIEKAGLWVTDIEVLRLHYAETLRHWRQRFVANWDKAKALYDDRFCRMWEFYLAASEVSFRHLKLCVFQIQMARTQEAVPLTRNYVEAWESERRGAALAANRRLSA